jgi:hypothetical protein
MLPTTSYDNEHSRKFSSRGSDLAQPLADSVSFGSVLAEKPL